MKPLADPVSLGTLRFGARAKKQEGHPLAGRSSRHKNSRGEEFVFLSPLIQLVGV